MPSITNLSLKLQTGTDNTYYATWSFLETAKKSASAIKYGDLVSIKPGATYYNGVDIPSWVMDQKWKIIEVSGNRAVLGENADGSNNICSPIDVKYLTGGSGGSTETPINTLDSYSVEWHYDTGDALWFSGGSSSTKEKYATYNPPQNAIRMKVSVKPVSKTYKVNDNDVSYWTGTTVSREYSISADPPEKPPTPTVIVEKYKLTASLDNISDARTDELQFEIYNGTKMVCVGVAIVATRQARYSCSVEAGGNYRVRCRAINLNHGSKIYGMWSDFSSSIGTIPSTPNSIISCKASSKTSVFLEWCEVPSATSYDLEYTTKKEHFDISGDTTTVSGIKFTRYEKTGLETGMEYFFRVRAVNGKGQSDWCGIKSVVIGKNPSAPTTWSSTTTSVTGEALTLYWVHNAEDRSSQTYAELELTIGGMMETHTIKNTGSDEEKDRVSFYSVDTSLYKEGTVIQWRVRTAGVTKIYGAWSMQRRVDVYAPVTLALSVTNLGGASIAILDSFPFFISGVAGPKTQIPIGYHLNITANELYKTADSIGNIKMVNCGEELYSRYFDISEALLVELSANNINLENGIRYTVTCSVSMNSGLSTSASSEFLVNWSDSKYEPDVEIGLNKDSFSVYLRPYCIDASGTKIPDVLLSIYRREYDGGFTELAKELDNTSNTYITDPHPALDYARYRIVATSKTTGSVGYYDAPGYPVGGTAVIVQWNEEWTNFDVTGGAKLEQMPWSGSMLKLPYNIDVSDKNQLDVALVEYIGRKRPVSYYGTQLGESSTWRIDIEKDDVETLYALRRLSLWTGDVYVREPSGSGYWANISVSFSQTHRELIIPVTLEVVRVEGGV